MANFDLSNLALKATCPSNEIILDDVGLPSVMVRIPKCKNSDVIKGGSDKTHSAFIVNGKEVDEIYISKYQNVSYNGRSYSLPGMPPGHTVSAEEAIKLCEAKGKGWHLMTNAEYALIALWCARNNFFPTGNNDFGKDHSESIYQAIPDTSYFDKERTTRVLTGTGPLTWSHNGQPDGIWDLNGNVWEWAGGLQLRGGEIQVLPNNDAADSNNSQSIDSDKWKAIDNNGNYVKPKSSNTLKYSIENGISLICENPKICGDSDWPSTQFKNLSKQSDLAIPEIAIALGLYPTDELKKSNEGDCLYVRNCDNERFALRGGHWVFGSGAGVSSLDLCDSRGARGGYIGWRSAFVKLEN